MTEIKKSVCPYDCPATCGLLCEVTDGKITKISADPEHPVSKNGICNKMQHYERGIYSPERILTPMKRIGRKGEGMFSPISWDEAIKTITDQWKAIIEESGSEAIWPILYSGVMSDIQRQCGDAFFARLGASELVKTLCASAKGTGYTHVVGKTGCRDPRQICDSDFYIFWGTNLVATRLQLLADMMKPENRDKKKILIDTYANPTAKYCDQVVLTKAGGDGALALAMMHVLEAEGLTDEAFLEKYTEGWQEFKETLPAYTPEWAESITGVPAADIRQLAIEYGHAKAPVIVLGSGNSRHGNGANTVRLITILSLLTGAWAKKGGGLCGCTPINTTYVDLKLIQRPDLRAKQARKLNINQIAQALALTGEEAVRSVYIYAGNPANTVSNQAGILKGLSREDLFTVVHERFMTDTAKYADILLPATFSVEQPDIYRAYGYNTLQTAWKVIDPPGECKSNWDTFALLAQAMGFEDEYFSRSEDEMLQFMLDHPTPAVAAISDEDRAVLQNGGGINMPFADHLDFGTPSGKAMIVNPSLPHPVPTYYPNHGGDYPLRLVAAPSRYSLNSTFTHRPDLIETRGHMTLKMNTSDAALRGIANGDSVIAYNELAKVGFIASVTDEVAKGCVICEGVYTADQSENGYNINALCHERLSDLGEATTMNDNTVEVRRH